MGWGEADWNDLTDENGYILLVEEGATNEHKRIVEWMDVNGVLHQEDASITLSITSSWGTYSTTIDAPTTAEGTIELALPEVAVTAVAPESSTAVANKSISGMVTVANTGQAPVSGVSIWCYVDDEVVETTQMVVSLEAGESKDVPFTWYMYEAGEATLTCKPLLPTALNDIADLVVDMSGSSSGPITWEYAEEVEEFPLIIWIVAIAGFMGLALMVAAQSRKQTEVKTYETHDEEDTSEEDEEDDDAPSAEEAEPTVENEEAPEEENQEEQAPSSIYDLKEVDDD
jgi:cytoskeletal protein RodZ